MSGEKSEFEVLPAHQKEDDNLDPRLEAEKNLGRICKLVNYWRTFEQKDMASNHHIFFQKGERKRHLNQIIFFSNPQECNTHSRC